MLHGTNGRPLSSQFGAFTDPAVLAVVFLVLLHSCRAQSRVIGRSQPVVSLVGEDVILPCHLEPVMNAFDMTLEWSRPDLVPRFVLVRRHGIELEDKKNPSFRGRTSMFIDELEKGNISLKLSKVKVSDEGIYKCFMPELSEHHDASTVQLFVDHGTPSTPSPPGNQHVVIGAVIGCAALVFIPAIIFVVWKRRQRKFNNERSGREDGREHSGEHSGLLKVNVQEPQIEQPQNINTDQKMESEETQQEAVRDEDEKETKNEKERPVTEKAGDTYKGADYNEHQEEVRETQTKHHREREERRRRADERRKTKLTKAGGVTEEVKVEGREGSEEESEMMKELKLKIEGRKKTYEQDSNEEGKGSD